MRTYLDDSPRVRIPIRRWEKVATKWNGRPATAQDELLNPYSIDETYKLEVMINGEILACDVRVPRLLGERDREGFRKHVIHQLASRISHVIADEIQRSIV